jgi:hypothetical protein
VAPAYRTIAYRAGCYGIRPEPAILLALADAGHQIDSSIVPSKRAISAANRIEFRSVPGQPNYYLSAEGGLERATAEGIIEAAGREWCDSRRRTPPTLMPRRPCPPCPYFVSKIGFGNHHIGEIISLASATRTNIINTTSEYCSEATIGRLGEITFLSGNS